MAVPAVTPQRGCRDGGGAVEDPFADLDQDQVADDNPDQRGEEPAQQRLEAEGMGDRCRGQQRAGALWLDLRQGSLRWEALSSWSETRKCCGASSGWWGWPGSLVVCVTACSRRRSWGSWLVWLG